MRGIELSINNLRNHASTRISLNPGLNIFSGMNGAGKTTILEAASISAFSKSFLNSSDSSLIRKGEDAFFISAACESDMTVPYRVAVKLAIGKRKEISSSIGENLTPKDIIGEIPMVILSPDYKAITFGSPDNRRSFIDRTLSQTSKIYYEDLIKHKRALKQRNALLAQARTDYRFVQTQISAWTEQFINISANIVVRRNKFISEFIPFFKDLYKTVSGGKEQADLTYQPDSLCVENIENKEIIIEKYCEIATQASQEEFRRGTTLFGPQKDDLKIFINGGLAKEYASQGQHKSLLIAIKFAEFEYLKSRRQETPLILLDDIFSELDAQRAAKVFSLVHNNRAQSLITVTDAAIINNLMPLDSDYKIFQVDNGIILGDDE